MENKLLLEINQIRRNMGLQVITEEINILLESPQSDALKNIFNGFFRQSSTSILKTLLSAEEKLMVKKFIKGEISETSDDVTKSEFANFIKSSNGVKTIEELEQAIQKARTRANNPIDAQTEGYMRAIVNDMKRVKINWAKAKNPLAKTWDELGGLTEKDVQWLEKVHGKNWAKVFYKFFDSVKRMFKSEVGLLDETLNLIKQMDIDKTSVNIANYKKQISSNFEKLTKMRLDNFSRINDWILTNVPRDVRIRLDKENLNGYGKAKKLATGDFKVEFEKEYGNFRDRIDKFWSQFWAITIPTKGRIAERWGSKGKLYTDLRRLTRMNQSEYTKTNLQELKADFWLGSTLTPAAWSKYYSQAGLKDTVKKYLSEYASIYLKINIAIATFELVIDAAAKSIEDWQFFKDYRWVHDLSMNYNKNYAKAKGLGSIEEFEEYKKNHDNLRLEGDELLKLWAYYLKDQLLTVESFIPGLWDNALKGLYDFSLWYTDPNTKVDNEESKKIIEDAKKDLEDAKKRLKDKEKQITDSLSTGELPGVNFGKDTIPDNNTKTDTIPNNDTKTDTISRQL
jgi:hypothetical protein